MIPELETADFEAILAPLAGDQPTGVDLRAGFRANLDLLSSSRRPCRGARRRAAGRATARRRRRGGLPALWRPVATMAIGALKSNSKDLEVATWLTEALVRIAGLRGLMAGAAVIAGLVERYWDGLFPMPDEDGMETRVAAVAELSGQGADGTLMQPLRKSTLFRRPDGSPFSLWQYQAARSNCPASPIRRGAPSGSTAGVMPFEEVEKEARAGGCCPLVGAARCDRRGHCVLEGDGARARRKGRPCKPVGQSGAASCWNSCLETCRRFAPPERRRMAVGRATGSAAGETARAVAATPGAITGREQALRQLAEIAAWFKRNEPSSPIGFTLDEAVRRARLAWPDLVAGTGRRRDQRVSALLTSAGMKPPPSLSRQAVAIVPVPIPAERQAECADRTGRSAGVDEAVSSPSSPADRR